MMNNELQNSKFNIPCSILKDKYHKNGNSSKRKHWFIA
jgi:hypothetical protein